MPPEKETDAPAEKTMSEKAPDQANPAELSESGQREMHDAENIENDAAEKIDVFGEIRMAEENADGLSDADIEIVNTATETEEVFFENMSASEHIENDAAKKDAAVETEIAESVESAPFALSAKADAESSAMEAVDIDSFMETTSNVPPPEDSIFAEPLQLGEPRTDNAAHKEIKPIDFDVVSAPNFLFLDEDRKIKKPRYDSDTTEAEDIQPFENEKGAVPFSFTSFASNEAKIQNLPSVSDDVIVEGSDGVFSIASGIAFEGVVQDEAFKRLVDSVVH